MSSRDRLPHGRSIQPTSTRVVSHGTVSDRQQNHQAPHIELLQNTITSQAAEIDQLSIDKRKLTASYTVLRDDLITAQREVQGLRAHIRGIETESDVQIRATLEKIAKMEAVVKDGENIRRELQLAHIEAQKLKREREELMLHVQSGSEELKKRRSDVANLKELRAERERLKEDYKRIKTRFQEAKGMNIEEVSKLKEMEKKVMGAVKDIETLRSEIVNAQNRSLVFPPQHVMH